METIKLQLKFQFPNNPEAIEIAGKYLVEFVLKVHGTSKSAEEKFLQAIEKNFEPRFKISEFDEMMARTYHEPYWKQFLKDPMRPTKSYRLLARMIVVNPEEFIENSDYHKIFNLLKIKNKELRNNQELKLLFEANAIENDTEWRLKLAKGSSIKSIKNISLALINKYFGKFNWRYILANGKGVEELFENGDLAHRISHQFLYQPSLIMLRNLSTESLKNIILEINETAILETDTLPRFIFFQENFRKALFSLSEAQIKKFLINRIPDDKELRKTLKMLVLGKTEVPQKVIDGMYEKLTSDLLLTENILKSDSRFCGFMKLANNIRITKDFSPFDREILKL